MLVLLSQLSTSVWSGDGLGDELQACLVEALGDAEGILVIDESCLRDWQNE
jgi:hypothetical protein